MTNDLIVLIGVVTLAVIGLITFVYQQDSSKRLDRMDQEYREELYRSKQYFRDLLSKMPPPTASPTASPTESGSYSWSISQSPSASPSPSASYSPSPSEEPGEDDHEQEYDHPLLRRPSYSPRVNNLICRYCHMPLKSADAQLCTYCGAPTPKYRY